ncbi:MAG TPA: phosphodiester glycosidase family protein [Phnomibacter sp.]|nr:phosphodiester glycosidase family protein [Phnomibacter sp.]
MNWVNVDSLYAPLPEGMHVYKTTTYLDGKPNIAFYVSAELNSKALHFTTQVGRGKRWTPQQFFEQDRKPTIVVNGTFFSFADNRNLNLVIRNGQLQAYNLPTIKNPKDSLQYYYITRSAIGIDKHNRADVAWLFTDTSMKYAYSLLNGPATHTGPKADPEWPDIARGLNGGGRKKVRWKMETAIGGGPMLLQAGRVAITNQAERMFINGENDRHPRTAMGYTKSGKLIILAVEGRNPGKAEGATLLQEASMLQQLGCWEALNLDGGGSSCLLVNGKETIKPSDKEGQRPVPAVFEVYAR